MPLRTGVFCALLLLGSCAAQTQPPVRKALAPAPPTGLRGIILAIRPVPPASPQPVQVLLSGLDPHAGPTAALPVFELIVRTTTGTTIAVVQPESGNFQPGEHVSILSGTPPRIDAPVNPPHELTAVAPTGRMGYPPAAQ